MNKKIITTVISLAILCAIVFVFVNQKNREVAVPTPVTNDTPNPTLATTPVPENPTGVITKDSVTKAVLDKKYDVARKNLDQLLTQNPADPELLYTSYVLSGLVGDFDGALTAITKAVTYDSKNTTYWKSKVSATRNKLYQDKVLDTSAEYRNAVKAIYTAALTATSQNIEIIMPYAIYLESIGDKAGAIAYWQKAIAANPQARTSYQGNIDRLSK